MTIQSTSRKSLYGGTASAAMLVAWIIISYSAGGIGMLLGGGAGGDTKWYASLNKSSLTPPGWVFPVVWNILYFMMAVAAWLVWRRRGSGRTAALVLFGVQLAFNAAWSGLFFGLQNPAAAMADLAALWLAIIATVVMFLRISTPAGLLMLPYLAWATFAAYLNATLVAMN